MDFPVRPEFRRQHIDGDARHGRPAASPPGPTDPLRRALTPTAEDVAVETLNDSPLDSVATRRAAIDLLDKLGNLSHRQLLELGPFLRRLEGTVDPNISQSVHLLGAKLRRRLDAHARPQPAPARAPESPLQRELMGNGVGQSLMSTETLAKKALAEPSAATLTKLGCRMKALLRTVDGLSPHAKEQLVATGAPAQLAGVVTELLGSEDSARFRAQHREVSQHHEALKQLGVGYA